MLARYQLQQLRQKNEELIDDFMTRCRNQATKCRFRDTAESDKRLIEQFIVRTKHKKVQKRLSEKGEQLTLYEAIVITRTYEAIVSQVEQLDGENNNEIHGIKENDNDKKTKKSFNCGLEHPSFKPRDKCPAYGYVCLNCHKDHHWARVARKEIKK